MWIESIGWILLSFRQATCQCSHAATDHRLPLDVDPVEQRAGDDHNNGGGGSNRDVIKVNMMMYRPRRTIE
jgi:hypothetical protein